MALASAFAACSTQHHGAKTSSAAAAPDVSNQPGATIQISYAHNDDFLRSVMVTKFVSAEMIPIRPGEEVKGASVVRFGGGGVPVWEIHADEGVGREILTQVPLIAAGREFALKQVTYGVTPKNFLQTNPDAGPPEPIQIGSYYVFRVERASGSASYQAVKIDSDGSIEGYDAEPRAGDSYALCCNVSSDFASSSSP